MGNFRSDYKIRRSSNKKQKKTTNRKTKNRKITDRKGTIKGKSQKIKKSRRQSKNINNNLKPVGGIKQSELGWSQFNFWNTIFDPYHIKHSYKDKDDLVYAQLIIFKKPQKDIRGFIQFYIDGPITLNRTDKGYEDSVRRISVDFDDRIVFREGTAEDDVVTVIDYVPKYQRQIRQNKEGIFDEDQEFRLVSDDRILDIRNIFSWLINRAEPEDFEDILKYVTIEKGIVVKDKEKFKINDIIKQNKKTREKTTGKTNDETDDKSKDELNHITNHKMNE